MATSTFCSKVRTRSTIAAAFAWVLLGVPLPAWASTVNWALYEPSCTGGSSTIVVECGDYGVFHFLDIDAPDGCTPIVQGLEDPPPYGQPGFWHAFPVSPPMLEEGIVLHPLGASSLGAAAHSSGGGAHAMWTGAPQTPPTGGDPPAAWIGVIDFDNAHGASTTWLADEVAGPEVEAYLTVLDDPALDPLGPVGDFHVLAKLCAIAEESDDGDVDAPRVVNMSFGRSLIAGDDAGQATCNVHRGSCQIARVIEHLRTQGTRFVAAAGNHQELLFPAALPNVLAAGMLDVTSFFKGTTRPAWETPGAARAWIPGNALCLEEWAAPSGSSYSSAMLAGWLSEVIEHSPDIDVLSGAIWVPRWNQIKNCYTLSFGNRLTPWCSDQIDVLFAGLAGASEDVCWLVSTTPSIEVPAPGPPEGQPSLPSASASAPGTHPMPESDPCVPCVGELVSNGGANDLVIDLSQSSPLPTGIYLDSVLLRTGSAFYAVPLESGQLDEIQHGTLAQLNLPGWGSLLLTTQQPSLVYRLKTNPMGNCSVLGTCFWSSTPVLLKS